MVATFLEMAISCTGFRERGKMLKVNRKLDTTCESSRRNNIQRNGKKARARGLIRRVDHVISRFGHID